jgi:nitrate/nitrite transport system permease protein
MSALAKKEKLSTIASAKPAGTVVPFSGRQVAKVDFRRMGAAALRNVAPPVVVLALILLVWQVLCSSPQASLPSPHVVWTEAYDLIAYPFFNYGSQDIGLGWRVLVSLQRVAYGFGLAAVTGVIVGAIIGQSVWAMRGLDPIFQVLRTVPPLAWLPLSLAAFQDSNPSAISRRTIATSPRCCASTSSNSSSRSCCRRPHLTSSPACASASAFPGWRSSPRKC